MNIEKRKLKELIPAPYNPRTISREELEKLRKSIKEFGYIDPLIINKQTGHIVGGNQRYKVLKELLGENAEIDVIIIDIDPEREKALNIALNRISGEFNEYKLNQLLLEMRDNQELLSLTGLDKKEIDNLLSNLDNQEYSIKELSSIDKNELVQTITLKFIPEKYEAIVNFFNEYMKKYSLNSREEVLIMLAEKGCKEWLLVGISWSLTKW